MTIDPLLKSLVAGSDGTIPEVAPAATPDLDRMLTKRAAPSDDLDTSAWNRSHLHPVMSAWDARGDRHSTGALFKSIASVQRDAMLKAHGERHSSISQQLLELYERLSEIFTPAETRQAAKAVECLDVGCSVRSPTRR